MALTTTLETMIADATLLSAMHRSVVHSVLTPGIQAVSIMYSSTIHEL